VLALSADGIVVRATGQMEGLNPGGGNFGPDGRYFVGSRSRSTVMAFAPALDAAGEHFLQRRSCRFHADLLSVTMEDFFSPQGSTPMAWATKLLLRLTPVSG
jgi:hypothetical protein